MKVKFGKRTAFVFLAVAIGIWPIIYLALSFDPSYEVAKSFVMTNAAVAEAIGSVEKASLAFFARNYVTTKGLVGSASYKVVATGKNKTGSVQVELIRHGGAWQVAHAVLSMNTDQKITIVQPPVSE